MAVDMSALSRMQTNAFSENNVPVTQKQCDDKSQDLTGNSVSPTACQGEASYTVNAGEVVVQFRCLDSLLGMSCITNIEQAYPGFTP